MPYKWKKECNLLTVMLIFYLEDNVTKETLKTYLLFFNVLNIYTYVGPILCHVLWIRQ